MTIEPDAIEADNSRLLSVIGSSTFRIYPSEYIWTSMRPGQGPSEDALACVRDGLSWFEFVPATNEPAKERYFVVSFNFSEEASASGFVAWLATYLKLQANTGVVVICGKDARNTSGLLAAANGVFDYWCCMTEAKPRFLAAIQTLIERGKALPK